MPVNWSIGRVHGVAQADENCWHVVVGVQLPREVSRSKAALGSSAGCLMEVLCAG